MRTVRRSWWVACALVSGLGCAVQSGDDVGSGSEALTCVTAACRGAGVSGAVTPIHAMPVLGAGGLASAAPSVETPTELSYHGGSAGIGVETAPRIYLVFYGSQWSADPSGEAFILSEFFARIGGSSWNATATQYCQGVASGTVSCAGAGQDVGNPSGVLAGYWYDNATAAPAQPTDAQLAAEAVSAAGHFGNTTSASNASVQYLIATAHGNGAVGFPTSYCAWHASTASAYGSVAFTNFPYVTDAGAGCGANYNGLGANAGITIVAGHEFAETETDPRDGSGWTDASGDEIGDKCAWIGSGRQGAIANITLGNATFPVQSLWSNAFNGGAGGCVLSAPPVCSPRASRACCSFAQGCGCHGEQVCNANGSAWGTCEGSTPKGTVCQ